MSPGSLLYPRLRSDAAAQLLQEEATLGLEELRRLSRLEHPDAAPAPTGGRPVSRPEIEAVRAAIRDTAGWAGYPSPLRGSEREFDEKCGAVLFETMGIVTADAADVGVWSFLSLVVLPEIGPWRYPGRHPERLTGGPRNVLRMLWWRAWALGPETSPPAGCEPLGEDEYVAIMERSLGGNPRIARGLRDALWRCERMKPGFARSEIMRRMALRLRAARSHTCLDALSDLQLESLLDRIIVDSINDLRRRSESA